MADVVQRMLDSRERDGQELRPDVVVVADNRQIVGNAQPKLLQALHCGEREDIGAADERGDLRIALQHLARLAAGKRTKQIWTIVTGVAALLGFLTLGNPLNLFALLGVVGAGIYLADVRPALQALGGGSSGRSRDTW